MSPPGAVFVADTSSKSLVLFSSSNMDSKSLHAASTAVDKLCVLVLANNMYEEEGLFGGSFIGA